MSRYFIDRFAEILILKAGKDRAKLVQVIRQVKGKNKTFPRHYWVKPEQVKDSDVVVSNHELLPKKHKALKNGKKEKPKSPRPKPVKQKKPISEKQKVLKKEKKEPPKEKSKPQKAEVVSKKFQSFEDVEKNYLSDLIRTRWDIVGADDSNNIGINIPEKYSDLFESDSMSDILAVRDIKNSYLFFKNSKGMPRALKIPSLSNYSKSLSDGDRKKFIEKYRHDAVCLGEDLKNFADCTDIGVRKADQFASDLPQIQWFKKIKIDGMDKVNSEWDDRWSSLVDTDNFSKTMDFNLDHNLNDSELTTYKENLSESFSVGKKINLIQKNISLFSSPDMEFNDSEFHAINKFLKIDLFDKMGILFGGSDSDVSPEELKETLMENSNDKFLKIQSVMKEQRESNPIDTAITSINKINLKEISSGDVLQASNPLVEQLKKYSKAIKNRDRVFNSYKSIESANKGELWKALQKSDKERKLLHNMTVQSFGEKAYKNGWDGEAVLEMLGITNGEKPDLESYLQIGNYLAKNKIPNHTTAFGLNDESQIQSKFFLDSKKDKSFENMKQYVGIAKTIVESNPSEGHTVKSLLKKYNKSLSDFSKSSIHFRDAFRRGHVQHELSQMKRTKVDNIVSKFVLDTFIQKVGK